MLGWWKGIHGELKLRCPKGHVGSNPTPGTTALVSEIGLAVRGDEGAVPVSRSGFDSLVDDA